MFDLYKRELKRLSRFLPAVISTLALCVAIVITLTVTLSMNSVEGEGRTQIACFENLITVASVLFALVIPAVVVGTVAKDGCGEKPSYLDSLPISFTQIVLARMLATFTVFLLPIAFIAVIPPILASLCEINFLVFYLSVLMLAIFTAFIISLSFAITLRVKKSGLSAAIVYLIIFASFLLGIISPLMRLLPFGASAGGVLSEILNGLSIFEKLDYVLFELFDWTALLFFLFGIALFSFLSVKAYKQNKRLGKDVAKKSKKPNGYTKKGFATLSVLLLICIGVLPVLMPWSARQIDVNEEKLYTPANSIKKYLSSVDEEITVYLIDPYTNETKLHNAIIRTVESGGNLKLKVINSATDKAFLEKYGLDDKSQAELSYAMIIEGEKRWQFINGAEYFMYENEVLGYMTQEELETRYTYCLSILYEFQPKYDSLSSEMRTLIDNYYAMAQSLQTETEVCLCVDRAIAEAVSYVTAKNIPTVYVLSGHGEDGAVSNSFKLSEEDIPENAELIIINSPSEDYSASEVDKLISYLDAGGKLYIMADRENYSMPNLARLLSHYGLSVEDAVITENESDVVDVSVNKKHEALSSLTASEVTVKGVSKISADADNAKYTYTTMLSYNHTVDEEGVEAAYEYPVAVSVSEGDEPKIVLFTGAITFNGGDIGIESEVLERTSLCFGATLDWLFEPFEPDIPETPYKSYERELCVANSSTVTKITVLLLLAVFVIAFAVTLNIVLRNLRSKKAISGEDNF